MSMGWEKLGDIERKSSHQFGASPAFAKHIRRWFQSVLPDGVDDFLQKMRRLRSELLKGKERMKKFDAMVEAYFREHFSR